MNLVIFVLVRTVRGVTSKTQGSKCVMYVYSWTSVRLLTALQYASRYAVWDATRQILARHEGEGLAFRGPCIVIYSYNKKPTRCTISQLYFGKELYMFRTNLLSIIRSLNTVFTAIGICHTGYVDCMLVRSGWNSLADSQHNQYDKYQLLWILYWDSWWWTVSLSETCSVLTKIKMGNSASCWLLL